MRSAPDPINDALKTTATNCTRNMNESSYRYNSWADDVCISINICLLSYPRYVRSWEILLRVRMVISVILYQHGMVINICPRRRHGIWLTYAHARDIYCMPQWFPLVECRRMPKKFGTMRRLIRRSRCAYWLRTIVSIDHTAACSISAITSIVFPWRIIE